MGERGGRDYGSGAPNISATGRAFLRAAADGSSQDRLMALVERVWRRRILHPRRPCKEPLGRRTVRCHTTLSINLSATL